MKPGNGFKTPSMNAHEVIDEDGWIRKDKSVRQASPLPPTVERVRSKVVVADPSKFRLPTPVTREVLALPKMPKLRSAALKEMAQGRDCLLSVPEHRFHDPATTVLCHANWSDMEKGGGRKAQDIFSVWGCGPCHAWLDQGPSPYKAKRFTFLMAYSRQLDAWRLIADNPREPERFRKAALWALEQYGESKFDLQSKMADVSAHAGIAS